MHIHKFGLSQKRSACVFNLALLGFASQLLAIDYTYQSTTTNTAWNTSVAWSPEGSPSSIADNVIGNSNFATLQVNANYTIGNFTATGGSAWVINSSVPSPGATLDIQTLANTGAGLLTFRTNGGNPLGLTVNQVNVTNGNIQLGAPGAAAGTLGALTVGTGVSLSGGNLLVRTAGTQSSYNLKAVNFSGSTTAGISLINNSSAGTGDVRTATVTSLNSSGTGAYTIQGSAVLWTGFTHAATLVIDNSGTDSANVSLVNGTGGTLALVKNGAGTQTLTGTSTFSAGTTVNAGTLLLGSEGVFQGATGLVSVVGGTFGSTVANANLGGGLTVGGGTLDPNSTAVGNLTLGTDGNFAMSGGTFNVEFDGANADQIIGSGTGTFNITGGVLALNTASFGGYELSYNLFNGFSSGSVSNLAITGYDDTSWLADLSSQGVLSFTAVVPEPSTYALLGGALLSLAVWHRRRKSS